MKELKNQIVEVRGSETMRKYHVIEENGEDIRLIPIALPTYPLNWAERGMLKDGGIWLKHEDVIIC